MLLQRAQSIGHLERSTPTIAERYQEALAPPTKGKSMWDIFSSRKAEPETFQASIEGKTKTYDVNKFCKVFTGGSESGTFLHSKIKGILQTAVEGSKSSGPLDLEELINHIDTKQKYEGVTSSRPEKKTQPFRSDSPSTESRTDSVSSTELSLESNSINSSRSSQKRVSFAESTTIVSTYRTNKEAEPFDPEHDEYFYDRSSLLMGTEIVERQNQMQIEQLADRLIQK